MHFFLRSPQNHLRKLSRSLSILESRLNPAFSPYPSSYSSSSYTPGRQLSYTLSRRFLPDFASRPVSYSSPFHQKTNGISYKTSISRDPTLGSVEKAEIKFTVENLKLEPLCDQEILDYFAKRKISKKTLVRNRVMQKKFGDEIWIAFTYWQRGELVSCKYRSLTKKFFQERNRERIFYGLDDIAKASEIIIVEGEINKLAMEEAGLRNCVSVPNGPPASVSKETPPESMDTKYKFLWKCKDYLEKASHIVIATDGDGPGQALAEEIARRVGKERFWRVKWPKKSEDGHFKDANEVLMSMGPDVLNEAVKAAEPYPIQGLLPLKDFFGEMDAYYNQTHGQEYGNSTGWTNLDNFYSVLPGELTVVTGVPNSGKSEWIDALLVNLNHSVGWKFSLFSMESTLRDHCRKLIEKHVNKPFFDPDCRRGTQRMSVEDLEIGKLWLEDGFSFIRSQMDSLPSIDWVLDCAKAAVLRFGIRGLVIDPYNELDHSHTNQTETEYVSQMLTKVKQFAQNHSCHVWIVAHPKQLQHWDGGPPNLYDISGSANFINKCDNGIIIHRNRDKRVGPVDLVQVCVRKVRNKVAGQMGDAYLCYDRETGVYSVSPVKLARK